ncbi:MAG: hypothetical protein JXA67_07410 [Micromonosporaceae bacterium]|nr:hypothetical protein [Micromonosporaceae bacterium]
MVERALLSVLAAVSTGETRFAAALVGVVTLEMVEFLLDESSTPKGFATVTDLMPLFDSSSDSRDNASANVSDTSLGRAVSSSTRPLLDSSSPESSDSVKDDSGKDDSDDVSDTSLSSVSEEFHPSCSPTSASGEMPSR